MKYNVSPLGDAIELVIDHRGLTPKKLGGDWSNYGYRALSAKNIKTGKIVQKETIRYINPQMYKRWMPEEVERNDIFVTSEAPFGEIYLWDSDEKIVLSQRIFGLRVKKSFDPVYMFYYMCTNAFQGELSARASGTTVTGLRQPELLKCLIRYPDLSTQKRIGDILRNIDKKIQTNNEINDNLSLYRSNKSTSISPDISFGRRESLNSSSLMFSSIFSASFKYKDFNNSARGTKLSLLTGNNNSYAGRASLLKCKTVVPLTYPRQCSLKRLSCNNPPKRNFEKPNLGRTLTKSIENTIFLYLDLVNNTSAFPITSAFCVKSVWATSVSNNSATCCGFNFDDGSISLNPSILNPPFLSKFFIVAIADSGLSTNSEPLYEYPLIKDAILDKFTFSHPNFCSSGEYGRKCAIAA